MKNYKVRVNPIKNVPEMALVSWEDNRIEERLKKLQNALTIRKGQLSKENVGGWWYNRYKILIYQIEKEIEKAQRILDNRKINE